MSRHRLIAHVSRNRRLIEEAVTYRLEIEPAAAGEAARARTADDLAGLRQIADRAAATTDDALFTSLDTQFHLAVATAAHNRFFAEAVERVRLSLYEAIMLLPESPLLAAAQPPGAPADPRWAGGRGPAGGPAGDAHPCEPHRPQSAGPAQSPLTPLNLSGHLKAL